MGPRFLMMTSRRSTHPLKERTSKSANMELPMLSKLKRRGFIQTRGTISPGLGQPSSGKFILVTKTSALSKGDKIDKQTPYFRFCNASIIMATFGFFSQPTSSSPIQRLAKRYEIDKVFNLLTLLEQAFHRKNS